jgi:hypothetical protein
MRWDSGLMTRSLAIGFGAGLVSALLFSVVITGSPLGIVLSYAAPLPILIAALGWSHRAGLVALAVGAVAVALVLRPATGLAFAIGSGLPAWWIAYLTLLGRLTASAEPGSAPTMEWYPLGRLLLWIGGLAATVVLAGSMALGSGSHDAYRGLVTKLVETFMRLDAAAPADAELPTVAGVPGARLISIIVTLVPLIAATVFCLFFIVNAWLAGKAVAISGRLVRPWPFIPATRMPAQAIMILGAAIVAAFLPGYVGVAGMAVIGGLAMAFALQGLALLHHLTAGRPGRVGILICTYILTVFFGGTFLPLMAVAGFVDTATPLRRRFTLRSGPGPD